MKTITLVFSLIFLTNFTLTAQSDGKSHPITKESFKVKLKVQKNRTIEVISFVSSKGQKISAKLTNPGGLSRYKLQPGCIVEGSFKFTTFASEGGLGTTRKFKGIGIGEMMGCSIVTEVDPMVTKLAGVGDMAFRLN